MRNIYFNINILGLLFIFTSLMISCNYEQFFQESNADQIISDQVKREYDSLIKITQENKAERDRIQDASTIYKKYVGSTVTIVTDNGQLGSGFFIDDSLIATNYHVVHGATQVKIKLKDIEEYFPIDGFVAVNKNVDLIIIKSERTGKSIPICRTPLVEGEKVFVIGSPQGLPATISEGIVSAKRSTIDNYFIQITAPISQGSSGGPVINQKGEVTGVSVAQSREGQNLNFAIPAPELEILTAYKSSFVHPFSELVLSERTERINTTESSNMGRQIDEETITEWNDDTRLDFIKACMNSTDPQNNDPRAFEFCDCVYQKISYSYKPDDLRKLNKDVVGSFAEECIEEMNH